MKSEWKIKKINDIATVVNGGTPDTNRKDFWGGDILWITPKDMGKLSSIYVDDTERKITEAGLKNSSAKMIPPNSIILSSRAPIGHLAINNFEISTNQGCKGIIPKKEILTKYLFYFLRNSIELLNSLGTGTTFKELSSSKLNDVEIPLPPLPEQQRIVDILDQSFAAIDRAIENTEKNISNVDKLNFSYLQSKFDYSQKDWKEITLNDEKYIKIIDGDRGINYPKKEDFYSSGYCLFLNTKNVRPDGFNFDSTMFINIEKDKNLGKGKLSRNDIVLTTRGTIGNVAIYDNSVKYDQIRINSGMLIFRPNLEKIYPHYLFQIIQSNIFRSQIEQHKSGAAQPQLPIKTLRNFKIPLPNSIEKQKNIVAELSNLHATVLKLKLSFQNKLVKIQELKQSILHKAFTGEL